MNNTLLFDFTVDKAAKTVFVTREFDAELSLVWDAFTKQEILDQWTAPAPYVAKTKYMNFEVGGKRFYAMVGPDGKEVGAVYMPAPQSGSPMTYMLKGKQYIVVAISGAGFPGELVAYRLP